MNNVTPEDQRKARETYLSLSSMPKSMSNCPNDLLTDADKKSIEQIAQALADQREADAQLVETMGFEMKSFAKIASAIRKGTIR